MGVPENARRRMPEELLGHPCIRIRILAERIQFPLAEKAIAAGNGKRHDDTVADTDLFHSFADVDDLAHEFVSKNVPPFHRRHKAVIEVQIRAANRRRSDFDDRVALVEDLRIGDVDHLDLLLAVPTIGFHDSPKCLGFSCACRASGCGIRVPFHALSMSLNSRLETTRLFHRLAALSYFRETLSARPAGCPSVVNTSPVSMTCLKRLKSILIDCGGSSPNQAATAEPNVPAGGAYRISTVIIVPRLPGAGSKRTTPL